MAGGRPHPTASHRRAEHAIKLARSERPSERRATPSPSEGERGAGDTGAPQGAVPKESLFL